MVEFIIYAVIIILVSSAGAIVSGFMEHSSHVGSDTSNKNQDDTGSFSKPKTTHSKKCNGDCANCPPHYGYRYGRWYYGHNHVEGCEFGGNSCSGGRD